MTSGGDDIRFACPACGGRLRAPASQAGRKMRCPKCQADFDVPAASNFQPATRSVRGAASSARPGGQSPPVKKQSAPRDVPNIPVVCKVCNTRMYARRQQIGQRLACPDCGTMCTVAPPPPAVKKTQAAPDAGDELELEPAAARPTLKDLGMAHYFENDGPDADGAGSTTEAKGAPAADGGAGSSPVPPADRFVRERPAPTLKPSYLRCYAFAASPTAWAVFFGLSGWIFLVQVAVAFVIRVITERLFAMFAISLIGVVVFFSFLVALAYGMAIMESTSAGCEEVGDWPQVFQLDWLAQSFYTGYALILAMLVGSLPKMALGRVLPGLYWFVPLGVLILFPIILLSMLYNTSPLNPFSKRVLQSLGRGLGHWLAFYLATGSLFVVCIAATLGVFAWGGWIAFFFLAPLFAACWLAYFRMLGLVAWQVTVAFEAMDEAEEQAELAERAESAGPSAPDEQAESSDLKPPEPPIAPKAAPAGDDFFE